MLARCIKLDHDCGAICQLAVQAMAGGSYAEMMGGTAGFAKHRRRREHVLGGVQFAVTIYAENTIDPLTSLTEEGDQREIRSMITRMIDFLKLNGITSFFTNLVSPAAQNDTSGETEVSSLIANKEKEDW